jgi:hypothetical protein
VNAADIFNGILHDFANAQAAVAPKAADVVAMIDQRLFTNCVRSLFNIDGYLLPELTRDQQSQFLRDPVRYFIGTDKAQQDAIFREVSKRQVVA